MERALSPFFSIAEFAKIAAREPGGDAHAARHRCEKHRENRGRSRGPAGVFLRENTRRPFVPAFISDLLMQRLALSSSKRGHRVGRGSVGGLPERKLQGRAARFARKERGFELLAADT